LTRGRQDRNAENRCGAVLLSEDCLHCDGERAQRQYEALCKISAGVEKFFARSDDLAQRKKIEERFWPTWQNGGARQRQISGIGPIVKNKGRSVLRPVRKKPAPARTFRKIGAIILLCRQQL
jgi:hypothetical protein